ncbi:MAG TPA: hypothetical protein VIZ65_08685 [Cellvibrionaceae bacterium]
MKKQIGSFVALGAIICTGLTHAEPTSTKLKIVKVRPYNNASGGPGDVYIQTDRTGPCNTNTYRIPLAWGGGKESFSIAVTALVAGRDVEIEIDNAGCGTPAWATNVQSIYLW